MKLTPIQQAAIETNYGLTEPGRCDVCKAFGPRYQFYNEYTSEKGPIEMKLCPYCLERAVQCVGHWLRLEAHNENLR